MLVAVRRIEGKGKLESARRTLQLAGSVFRYAVATARLKSDPTRDLKGALTSPTVTHYGAVIDPAGVGELLRSIDGYEGQPITKFAMQLAPHVFVRPGELRHAEWSEIDLEGALWTIPAGKTKMRKEHVVPLSRQAIAILKSVQHLTGPNGYIFPFCPHPQTPHERQHDQCGPPPSGLCNRRNDRPRLPRNGVHAA